MKKHDRLETEEIITTMLSMKQVDDDLFFLMIGEKSQWNPLELISACRREELRIVGGIFPSLITGNTTSASGIIVKKYPASIAPVLVTGIDRSDFDLGVLPELSISTPDKKTTALVVIDGLTSGISSFLSGLYSQLGNTVNYIGGGAGSISFQQQPCVFTNDGIFQNAAIVAFIDTFVLLGVKHGWSRITGPLVATRTRKNMITELNWLPAFEVYADIIKNDSQLDLNQDNFFSIAKSYPFGIIKDKSEYVVRDPIKVTECGELICVGEVPENSVLDVLKGDIGHLIDAARQAAGQAIHKSLIFTSGLIFDCISRRLFLEDNFEKELDSIASVFNENGLALNPEGALTLGEISSTGQSYLEYYNKTIIIGLFHE
ncbi:FIST signal transduction protein [Mariniphaga sediminis]|uniref:FIST signal transduction protein n=1 Tax=Mariniphaga sediminis TaxID=1628158 RepID=UPI0035667B81